MNQLKPVLVLSLLWLSMLLFCTDRGNPGDPLGSAYRNEAPRISIALSYDTTIVKYSSSADSFYFFTPAPIHLKAHVFDDYEKFGKPYLSWIVSYVDSVILV